MPIITIKLKINESWSLKDATERAERAAEAAAKTDGTSPATVQSVSISR